MMVILTYDVPEPKDQNFLRKEYLRLGGKRIQYSVYAFLGEPFECARIIRQMSRLAKHIVGDIRLIPMEESVWKGQVVISETEFIADQIHGLPEFVVVW